MSRWSTILYTFALTDSGRGIGDTTAAAATTATEAAATAAEKVESWAETPPPRRCRRCRRAALTSVAEDDIRARFISESQVSKTISQTKIHGNNNNNKVKFTI